MNEQKILEIIQSFESVYKVAGKFAYKNQKDIRSRKKIKSGIKEIDAITPADSIVQEMVLKEWSKSPLRKCHLIAEETTDSIKLFTGKDIYYITIDPIDGTLLYADGKKYFSIIIGLHDGIKPLYTFIHFPALDWTHKIVNNKYIEEGKKPKIEITNNDKTIIYSYGNPKKTNPAVYRKYLNQNYIFKTKKMANNEAGSTALFLTGRLGGYYCENPVAIDGLVILHYAMANDYKIIKSKNLDLNNYIIGNHGLPQYKGYYLVTKK